MRIDNELIKNEVFICAQCHYCRVCPAYSVIKWESTSPRGRVYLLKGILKGEIDAEITAVEDFYKCTTCGACEVVCQTSIPLIDLWERARAEFVEKGKAPLPVHKKLKDYAEKNGNPYGEKREERAKWAENFALSESAELLYFAGCTASYRMKELAVNSVEFLRKAKMDFGYAGVDELCCGSPFLRTGQREIAYEFFRKNYEIWDRMGVEKILTSCAGCYRTIKRDYKEIGKELGMDWDFEVIHISQLMWSLVKSGEVELEEFGEQVTYHDPCHLGRHMNVYDEPRKVLESMNARIVEMESNRENALCCGAGGGLKSQFKDLSMEIGKRRIEEALNTGARYLISCCPFCKLHLKQASGGRIEVVDLIEIVNKHAKV